MYGRSDEDLGVPYQPWIEVLTRLVALAAEPLLAVHVADRGAHLSRWVPQLAASLAPRRRSGVTPTQSGWRCSDA